VERARKTPVLLSCVEESALVRFSVFVLGVNSILPPLSEFSQPFENSICKFPNEFSSLNV